MAQTTALTCALRALNLCDGQVLEDPEHALTKCLCAELRAQVEMGTRDSILISYEKREKLIERIMAD